MSEIVRLSATDIRVNRGDRSILDSVNIALKAGELIILAGPNGAGKTTLARVIAGLGKFEGSVVLNGVALHQLSARERAKALAYLPQGHQYHWPMPVRDIVALGRAPHADMFDRRTSDDTAAIEAAVKMTGIGDLASRTIITLSGGERARVALARALATKADVIIADEPIASVDERNQLIIMELLRSVAHQGTAVLAIIHDLSLAMRFADRIALMHKGRIVADDAPAAVLTAERIADIFGVAVERVETSHGPALIPSRAL